MNYEIFLLVERPVAAQFFIPETVPLYLPLVSTNLTGLLCGQKERMAKCYARPGSITIMSDHPFYHNNMSPHIMLRTSFVKRLDSQYSVSQTKSSNITWEPVRNAEFGALPQTF